MKKILVSMFAVAALAACSTEHTVVAPQNEAIGFDTFVENATRANDVDINSIKTFGFGVYASVTNGAGQSGLILENEAVTYNGDWGYTNTQYWVVGNDYNFTAFAPKADAKWAYAPANGTAQNGVISFDNAAAAANQDLVFAYAKRSVDEPLTAAPAKVGFTFNHMLSRVRFTFANGFESAGNIELAVSNVHITDAYANGTLEVKDGAPVAAAWAPANKTLDVTFGDAAATIIEGDKQSTEHFYLIPNSEATTYTVTFDVTLYQAGVEIDTYSHVVEFTCAMNRGMSYDIKTTLNAKNTSDDDSEIYPIEFTVDAVNNWAEYTEEATKELTKVATAQALVDAIAAGENVKLTADINLDDVVTRAAAAGLVVDKDLILDGNGFTVKTTAVRALQFTEGANVTIKNLTLDAPNSERGFQFQADGHNVVIENVTATSKNYTVYLTASSTNSNVVVKNCDLTGLNTINVWGENHNVKVENTKITTIDNNAAEGYASIYNNAENTTVYVNGGEVVITGSANDSFGGVVTASGASIIFNGTEGTTTIEGQPFVINYDNGYTYSFSTFAEAVETAKDGETIVMTQDVTIDNVLKVTDKNVTFNLNGHNISSTTDVFEVAGGALTIIGNGEVHAATSNGTPYCAVWAYGDAVVNIYGGTYKIGYPTGDYNDLIYAKGNAAINIHGGTFHNSGRENAFVLNVNDQNRATAAINVYGGSYEKFNPADNESEGADTNFVAPGKTVEQNGDWYIVK